MLRSRLVSVFARFFSVVDNDQAGRILMAIARNTSSSGDGRVEVGDQTQWALSTCPGIFGGRPGGVFLFDCPLPLSFSHRPPAVPADVEFPAIYLLLENIPSACRKDHRGSRSHLPADSSIRVQVDTLAAEPARQWLRRCAPFASTRSPSAPLNRPPFPSLRPLRGSLGGLFCSLFSDFNRGSAG